MKKYTFSDEEIEDTIRELAADSPDFIYERPEGVVQCRYVHGDAPGCLIGQALHFLGVPLADLVMFEGENAITLLRELTYTSEPIRRWASRVQDYQDSEATWAESVAYADRRRS